MDENCPELKHLVCLPGFISRNPQLQDTCPTNTSTSSNGYCRACDKENKNDQQYYVAPFLQYDEQHFYQPGCQQCISSMYPLTGEIDDTLKTQAPCNGRGTCVGYYSQQNNPYAPSATDNLDCTQSNTSSKLGQCKCKSPYTGPTCALLDPAASQDELNSACNHVGNNPTLIGTNNYAICDCRHTDQSGFYCQFTNVDGNLAAAQNNAGQYGSIMVEIDPKDTSEHIITTCNGQGVLQDGTCNCNEGYDPTTFCREITQASVASFASTVNNKYGPSSCDN